MIFDKQNIFADKTAFSTGGAATTVFGDVIDLWAGNTSQPNAALPQGVNGPVGGPGTAFVGRLDEVEIYAQVTDAVKSGGTGTLSLQLVAADDAALATNPVVLGQTAAITADAAGANMPAGMVFTITGDVGRLGQKRYLGLKQVIGTAALTAGAATAGLVFDKQSLHY